MQIVCSLIVERYFDQNISISRACIVKQMHSLILIHSPECMPHIDFELGGPMNSSYFLATEIDFFD